MAIATNNTNPWAFSGATTHTVSVDNSRPVALAVSEKVYEMQTILEHPVFEAKVSELKTAWLARFGSGWVKFSEVEHDDYFGFAARRLIKMGKLEMHAVNSTESWSPTHIMRLIKDE